MRTNLYFLTIFFCKVSGMCYRPGHTEPRSENINVTLLGYDYFNFKTTKLEVCEVQCLRDKQCQSINFHQSKKKCELNDESDRTVDRRNFRTYEEVVHVDITEMEGIEIYLGTCLGHLCPTRSICASTPNGSKARYTCLQEDNCNNTKFCPAPYYVCKSPLGRLFQNGHVASHIVSSKISTWNGYTVKTYSPKLYAKSGDSFTRHGGWVPSTSSIDEFIMLNMTTVCKLTGISTQGTHYYLYWVRSYTLSYSQDCVTWHTFLNHDGLPKYFSGNNNRDTVISHEFDHAILAKCVRLEPKTWNNRIGVRLDFTGCPVE